MVTHWSMRALAALSLLGVAAACTSSSGGSSSSSDASADADTCVTSGGPGFPCFESLVGYCAKWDASSCRTTWQGVRADPPCAAANGLRILFASCGSLNLMAINGVDTGTSYFFDATSGALVAVVELGDPAGFGCIAGPSCFTWKCGPFKEWSCADGGAPDAGD